MKLAAMWRKSGNLPAGMLSPNLDNFGCLGRGKWLRYDRWVPEEMIMDWTEANRELLRRRGRDRVVVLHSMGGNPSDVV